MRQAGRSLPEYRAKRGEGSILDAIKQPDLAAELTMQPVRRYGVDAAVLFSDIIVPAHAVGFGIDVAPGTGPVCQSPLRTAADMARLRPFDPPADTPYVLQAVEILAAELPESVPLLAFAGAPFTVASYLIEGRPSRTYEHTKRLMHTEPVLWHQLMARLVQHATASIASQLDHGARAFQLFDSWAGALGRADYDTSCSATPPRCSPRWPPVTPAYRASISASVATICSSRCTRPAPGARARLANLDH